LKVVALREIEDVNNTEILFFKTFLGDFAPGTPYSADSSSSEIHGEVFLKNVHRWRLKISTERAMSLRLIDEHEKKAGGRSNRTFSYQPKK
jgi:hypothetical protein